MSRILLVLILSIGVGLSGCWWVSDANKVAKQEVSPTALLKKYEDFKTLAAKIDARNADIQILEKQIGNLEDQYKGVHRKDWNRNDSSQYFIWQQELSGLKMSYNAMAADYNRKMAMENYKFCNQGDLPKGADKPLPREYREYKTQ